ncbi:MAG: hypothetical protein ACYCWE_21835 [Eubacteriales bacterium]
MYIMWDKQKNLIFPDGGERTPEQVYAEFPWTRYVGVAINKGVVTTSIENMEILRDVYNVDTDDLLDDETALTEINTVRAAQRTAAQTPPPEV